MPAAAPARAALSLRTGTGVSVGVLVGKAGRRPDSWSSERGGSHQGTRGAHP